MTLVLGVSRLHAQDSSTAIVTRAIEASGGSAALTALRAIEWVGSGTIHVPGREIRIRGTWWVLPPDTAGVVTYLADQDSSSARRLILAGNAGWTVRDTSITPMSPEMLTEERHQFYLYSLLRLVPLREPAVSLTLLAADSAGHPGVLVRRPDRLDVSLYFDAEGRVARMLSRFAALPGQPSATQEIMLRGETMIGQVRWFREMRILRDGQPYFDLQIDHGHPAPGPASAWLPRVDSGRAP